VALGMDGKNAEAAAQFEAAVSLDPSSATAHFHLAVAYAQLGRFAARLEPRQAIRAVSGTVPGARLSQGPAGPQSPLARSALPLLPRYYGLMRRSFGLSRPSTPRASSGSLGSLGHPLLVRRTVPILAYASALECHAPYAGGMPGALGQYFPGINGLHPTTQGSAVRKSPHQRFLVGLPFRHGRQSVMLWPSRLLALLTARHHCPQHPRAFALELPDESLPSRQSRMLPGRLADCRGWSFTSKKRSRLGRTIVQVDVGQERADDAPNAKGNFAFDRTLRYR
jgi:hypothetical protein